VLLETRVENVSLPNTSR